MSDVRWSPLGVALAGLIGIVLVLFGARLILRARATESWPTVQGRVASSKIHSYRREGKVERSLEVSYTYDVAGRTYQDTRISLSGASKFDEDEGHRVYAAGAPCTVHYNPADPADCVLEPGTLWTVWFLPGLGAVAIGLALFCFIRRP